MTTESIFNDYLGQNVKITFRDGTQFKVIRGKLEEIKGGHIKVVGKLGTIVIKEDLIEKMARTYDDV
jgi:ribosome maturation factor RimP